MKTDPRRGAAKGIGPLRMLEAFALAMLVLATVGVAWLLLSPAGRDWLAGLTPLEQRCLGAFCLIAGVLGAWYCARQWRRIG
ncbi:hypothetical protein P3W85_23460 [Cupriavidus basilensis]|uniref:Transmembrane protein n=1 Tax=Cupriavidus basilensis TaxID=68895 RepID=A0ABT6ATU2_9BURK|nr:hypothetical protein [Cupriavidus basilensis]MDF3835884.1 hypothetical protein [Cupriavidus basilensis]